MRCVCSVAYDFLMTPWTVVHQVPAPDKNTGVDCLQEMGSSSRDLLNPRIEPESPVLLAFAAGFFTTEPHI